MILAFHGATTMTSDLETDVAVSAKAGFKALEVWATKIDRYLEGHSVEELKLLFNDHDLTPITLNSIEFIAFRGSEYPQIQARLQQLGRISQVIGCPTIIIVPSPTPDRNMSWADIVSEYVKVLRDMSQIARKFGIKLSLEFLGFGWCSLRTPRAAFEVIQKCDRDNIGLTIDTAHFYAGGGLLNELDSLNPEHIFAVHLDDLEDSPKEAITDHMRLLPGAGIVPLADICQRLNHIGYDGPCSIELFRPEYWEWDPQDLALQARQAAIKVLSPYFHIE